MATVYNSIISSDTSWPYYTATVTNQIPTHHHAWVTSSDGDLICRGCFKRHAQPSVPLAV